MKIQYKVLSDENWNDFENLFGERGACGGCWCMFWRVTHKEFETNKGANNKSKMKNLVNQGKQIGIIFYIDNQPIGWCSFAPREDFVRLEKSRILKSIDKQKVWSIVCFFIDMRYRRKGYSVELLKSVINFAKKNKVEILEGYPVDAKSNDSPDVFMYTGLMQQYLKAGFVEVSRPSQRRSIMRFSLKKR